MYLVAGGAGFLGEVLIKKLLEQGNQVRSFDQNITNIEHRNLEVIQGNVLDFKSVENAMKGVDIVFNNIAQVPISKNKKLFWAVNEGGTKNLLEASLNGSVEHFIYTSSSAVYGAPVKNPVNEKTLPIPAEDYGKAKLAGENLCHKYNEKGLKCSIIRPRTILGTGRLGIFQILFEWIYQGLNIPVIDGGKNIYQFIHASDLVNASISASKMEVPGCYNIGATHFGSMHDVLSNLIQCSKSSSKIKSVSSKFTQKGMSITSMLGLSPLGAYHALMYGKSMYFDVKHAKEKLKFEPKYSNNEMFLESYKWYCENRDEIISGRLAGSGHKSAMKQKILKLVPYII
tara:strand:- start:28141 stop:29169 length:1029 start_codon:yes stop_codon:yes gene_type:complete